MKKMNPFLLILVVLLGISTVSCEKKKDNDDDGQPDDNFIPIDDNAAFSQANFIASFEQMFVADNRWAWDFDHTYDNGEVLTSTQNLKVFGELGKGIFEITHSYNDDRVIISSERSASEFESNVVVFTYEYDKDGYIIKLTKSSKGIVRDVVIHEFDENGLLMKKTHEPLDDDDLSWNEIFTYTTDGKVASYENENWEERYVYTYSGNDMVKSEIYEEGVLDEVITYAYDAEGRIKKMSEQDDDDNWYIEYEYDSDMVTEHYYEDGNLESSQEYGMGYTLQKSYEYYYDEMSGMFEYCRARDVDENGYTSKKYYYEGTLDDLVLIGYSVIDSRDLSKDGKKTKESVYDANDNLLYYVTFTLAQYEDDDWYIDTKQWFDADGNAIDEFSISESWVTILVR